MDSLLLVGLVIKRLMIYMFLDFYKQFFSCCLLSIAYGASRLWILRATLQSAVFVPATGPMKRVGTGRQPLIDNLYSSTGECDRKHGSEYLSLSGAFNQSKHVSSVGGFLGWSL
jgi:hypothetical protein